MVIKSSLLFFSGGRSRLMYLVTACDDEVSYYTTSRNFKITMNILRNQSDYVQSLLLLSYSSKYVFECAPCIRTCVRSLLRVRICTWS